MPDDAQDSLFDLKVLRSAAVEREIDEFIRKLREHPEKVEPIEVFAAIRKWFAAAEQTDAFMKIAQDWFNAPSRMVEGGDIPMPVMQFGGEFNDEWYVVGPMNLAWRDMLIRMLTSQVQQRFDNMDVSSQ